MEVWEKQQGEPDSAFQAFAEYRDQRAPRRLRQPMAQMSAWYREYSWPERVALWDMHLDDIRRAEKEALVKQDARAVAIEHMSMGKDLRDLFMLECGKFLKACQESEMPMVTKVSDITKLADMAVKIDRLIRDQATERVENTSDLSTLSLEDLKTLRSIVAKTEKPT